MEELYYLDPNGLLYLWHRLKDIFATSDNIPTALSQLTNDSNFQTADEVMGAIASAISALNIPVKVSDLINDSGYQTADDVSSAVNSAIAAADIPTKTSDLTNDADFQTGTDVDGKISTAISGITIPRSLSDLTNDMTFQTLSEITTLINDAIGESVGLKFEVVSTLPATGEGGTIYLVPNGAVLVPNIYDEYIYYNGSWEKIGSTDIDLSGYLRTTDVDSALSSTSENPVQNKVVKAALDNKVDKVTGKGLSTNDYTDPDKAIVDSVTSGLAQKVDKETGKGLSTNDYTNADKAIVDGVTAALDGKADASDIPTKTSDLTNDSNYVGDSSYVHTDNNYTTTEKNKLAGLSNYDDTDLTNRVSTLEGEIPSGASSSNKLVTASDLSGKQDVFQFSTMPTAASGNVGAIVQYTGATTSTYTNGYFYKCVNNGGSYSWENIEVQPSSGGGGASESEIAPVESTSTASQAYSVGDLLIYNGKLYRVTAAIASGGTITPNTNVVETSVSEVFVRKTGDTMTGGLATTNLTVGSRDSGTIGANSSALGYGNTATKSCSYAEGRSTSSRGNASHTEGTSTLADADNAHAEGQASQALAKGSHAEGYNAITSSNYSHAEGYFTKAQGLYAHAEGSGSIAIGEASHAEGNTTAGYDYQHTQGQFNNNKSTNAFEIGNGTADDARSNALEVTWDGDLTAEGTITDGDGNTFGKKLTATVSGTSLVFSDSSIISTAIIEGPYILDGWTGITEVSFNSSNNSITYTFSDSSCDAKSAIIFVR